MTDVTITPNPAGIQIQLLGVGPEKASLLETFNDCSTGSCACSTDEFKKVELMEINSTGDSITLSVTAKEGEVIDPACVSECVDFAQEKASQN